MIKYKWDELGAEPHVCLLRISGVFRCKQNLKNEILKEEEPRISGIKWWPFSHYYTAQDPPSQFRIDPSASPLSHYFLCLERRVRTTVSLWGLGGVNFGYPCPVYRVFGSCQKGNICRYIFYDKQMGHVGKRLKILKH